MSNPFISRNLLSYIENTVLGDLGATLMNDEILKGCRQAKERLTALFGDVDALMDFMMKRREKRMKQGVKYADFSPYRKRNQEKPDSSNLPDTESQV